MPANTDNPWPRAHSALALSRGLGVAEISADAVIAHLTNVGIRATKTGLASAHRAGLIARPRIGRLGRGKGTISYYPVETVGLYAFYQAALKVNRKDQDAKYAAEIKRLRAKIGQLVMDDDIRQEAMRPFRSGDQTSSVWSPTARERVNESVDS